MPMAEESIPKTASNFQVKARKTHRRESSGHICTACDQCYRCKVKCSGERPSCDRCRTNKSACTYSTGKPLGKPKGSKNKTSKSRNQASNSSENTSELDRIIGSDVVRHTSLKRTSDEDLPPAKRRASYSNISGEIRPVVTGNPTSPELDSSEHRHVDSGLAVTLSSHDLAPILSDPVPFYFEDSKPEDHLLGDGTSTPPSKTEDIFGPTDVGLEFEELGWFNTSDSIITTISTSPNADITTSHLPVQEPAALTIQPPVPPSQNNFTSTSPIKHSNFSPISLPCLCDPMALNIISELQFLQTSLSPLDTALILARRGFSTVSSSLQCPSCLSSSKSLFYACILIIQQVFTCYGTVKMQGPKMLSSTVTQEHGTTPHSVVSIGDFEVQDEEGCNVILDAIVRAEMERGKGVLGGLERWAENSANSSQKAAGLLIRTLREEIGC